MLGPGEAAPRADPLSIFADREAMDARLEESEGLLQKLIVRRPGKPSGFARWRPRQSASP